VNQKKNTSVFISFPVSRLTSNQNFPGDVYLCLNHHMVHYKTKDDILDEKTLNKLLFSGVQYVFIEEKDRKIFEDWADKIEKDEDETNQKRISDDAKEVAHAVVETRRAAMDIFSVARSEPQVKNAINESRKVVTEFLKKPYAVNNIALLQKYSKGAVDHSVNVSTLSVFLGLRLGYAHQVILENLALGGLFHDIGKVLIAKNGEILSEDSEEMKMHPVLGKQFLEKLKDKISNEVLMIVAQHHEFLDGSGYPYGLKGLAIYDLTRIVTIANIYDHLVTESKKNTMQERCEEALEKLSKNYEGKLDSKKLEKIIKIMKYSFM
jgi:putative nucleotidyltransferase with HDIG domain